MSELTKTKGLHPRIEELLEHLDETRGALLDAAAHVAPVHHHVAPAPGRWTLGEILDHVHRVETGYTRLLTKRVADARARGIAHETDTSSILATMKTRHLTDRTKRIEAPERVVPRSGARVDESLAALAASRAELRNALVDASGLALGTIAQDHPFFGNLDLYQWGVVLGFHDLRHAAQIREIGGEPGASAPAR